MSHHRYYESKHYKRSKDSDGVEYDIYRPTERPRARSKVMGVCAGIAHQFGWDVTVVRVLAVIGVFTFSGPVFLAYIIAGAIFY